MKNLHWMNAFLDIIFPRECILCNDILTQIESSLCCACKLNLPIHENTDELFSRFWGHINIDFAFSLLQYSKEGSVQKLLKEIKYNKNQILALELGLLLAKELKEQDYFPESIIPVPLHPEKYKKRTFNQSELLSKAFAEELKIENDITSVIRKSNNSSQTKLERYNRWLNVEEVFEVVKPEKIEGRSIAIIDDVITTGATIGSLAGLIQEHNPKSLAVLSLAST